MKLTPQQQAEIRHQVEYARMIRDSYERQKAPMSETKLDPELLERMLTILEALNLRGLVCPICTSPLVFGHKEQCELYQLILDLRKARYGEP